MAWIKNIGQISRLSFQHQSLTCLNLQKPLFSFKTSTPVSHLVKNVHVLRQTCRHRTLMPFYKMNFTNGFHFPLLTQSLSRTFSSFSRGRHLMYIISPLRLTSRYVSAHGGGSSSKSNQTVLIYIVAIFVFMIGAAYAGVPLYKVFCQATGLGGQAVSKNETDKIESMQKVDRLIKIRFNADVASSMRWNFRPQQTEVTVSPGETALAFYTAQNPTDKPIIGISTYNILPYDAGQYFNKIQCFCFEEQRLNPKEQVDMPVFFYIDPEFAEDPKLENVKTITLSYTFFEAKEGLQLPLPGYPQPHDPVLST